MSTGKPNGSPAEKRLRIDPGSPDPAVIRRAASILRQGGVVIFPTSFLYGLGADATRPEAVSRIFSIKRRRPTNPVSILINQKQDLAGLVTEVPEAANRIMEQLWPGKITLVFPASARLPANLTANTGKIGIRLPLHPGAKMLVAEASIPITATSVNLSGEPACSRIEEIPQSILDAVDLILDAGPLPGGTGSTVVDVTVSPPRILRDGAVSAETILAAAIG